MLELSHYQKESESHKRGVGVILLLERHLDSILSVGKTRKAKTATVGKDTSSCEHNRMELETLKFVVRAAQSSPSL